MVILKKNTMLNVYGKYVKKIFIFSRLAQINITA